jgi:uncharacterized membrane protein YhiD involved in acid resistance
MLDHMLVRSTFLSASLIDIIYACLLAFILGVAIAFTYVRSFSGLSYSRAFIQSLIFAPMLTAIAMQAVGDSMARGLGMLGAFSLLRFKTNIKDSRDMMFMFASLAAGLACGVYSYPIAVVSIILFCLAVYIVHNIPFSVDSDFDAVLRLQVDNTVELQSNVDRVLADFARRYALISMREMGQGSRLDMTYQVKMQKGKMQTELVSELGKIASLRDIHVFVQDQAHEV